MKTSNTPIIKTDLINKIGLTNVNMICRKIGENIHNWQIHEIGDGNVNLIFKIQGDKNQQILVKQAVPYLRCVGESWPLSMDRNFFEYTALKEHGKHASDLMPEVYSYEKSTAALVMEFLENHIIMRKMMMAGIKCEAFTEHISDYMAKTLFFTSDLALSAAEKKEKMKLFCDNTDLCKITEDLIFTDPYHNAARNRWTTPWLDPLVATIQNDLKLKVAITEMKAKFLTSTESLIHGDLHTGSIMVKDDLNASSEPSFQSTKVIDPEFAFYGPMGFDVGLLLGNFIMSYFSQAGLAETENQRADYESWILLQIKNIWLKFSEKFSALWDTHLTGDYLSQNLLQGPDAKDLLFEIRKNYLNNLFEDSIRFAGAEIIRRIVGLAHVADLDEIKDLERRSISETRAIHAARELLVNPRHYKNIEHVLELMKKVRHQSVLSQPALHLQNLESGF